MPREQELVERAETYRDMARAALDPRLRIEFSDRAERFETAAWAVSRARRQPRDATEPGAGSPTQAGPSMNEKGPAAR